MADRPERSSVAWKLGAWVGKSRRAARSAWSVVRTGAGPRRDPDMERWYANLELPYGARLDEVRRARKRLLARYHPDRHAVDPSRADRAAELTLAIHHAYESLAERLKE